MIVKGLSRSVIESDDTKTTFQTANETSRLLEECQLEENGTKSAYAKGHNTIRVEWQSRLYLYFIFSLNDTYNFSNSNHFSMTQSASRRQATAYGKRKRSVNDKLATRLQENNNNGIQHLLAEDDSVLNNVTPKPFLETRLGGLASEIREIIFTNLLAIPPPYIGRNFRAEQISGGCGAPMPLTTFVDLKASHLAILQTCRQLYLEASPRFYASKAYYLANAPDLRNFLELGGGITTRTQLLRLDTITSLCLQNLVINRPRWNADQIDSLVSTLPSFDRQALEDERVSELDFQLILVDLEPMRNLRNICLCMRVGQELEYLGFLFGVRGLGRGVVDFVDDFHWSIRSQDLEDDWKTQYATFGGIFYRTGKNYEELDYDDMEIQREVLNIDSRASDLVEGDERWVEVDIGARNYEENMQIYQRGLEFVSEKQEDEENGDSVEGLQTDAADQLSEHLEESMIPEGNTPADTESDRNSDDLHNQSDEEDHHPNQESDPSNLVADVDVDNGSTISDLNGQSEANAGPAHEQSSITNVMETVPDEDSEGRLSLQEEEIFGTTGEAEAHQDLHGFVDLLGIIDAYAQTEISPSETLPMLGDWANQNDREDQPGATRIPPIPPHWNYRDAQIQTEPAQIRLSNAETQTESGNLAEDLQDKSKLAAPSPQKLSIPGQGAKPQSMVQDSRPASAQSKPTEPEESTRSHAREEMATKSVSNLDHSPNVQQPLQEATKMSSADSPHASLATMKCNSIKGPEPPLQPAWYTHHHLRTCFSVVLLMLALYLFTVSLSANREDTLWQLLNLFLSILISFMAAVVKEGREVEIAAKWM